MSYTPECVTSLLPDRDKGGPLDPLPMFCEVLHTAIEPGRLIQLAEIEAISRVELDTTAHYLWSCGGV